MNNEISLGGVSMQPNIIATSVLFDGFDTFDLSFNVTGSDTGSFTVTLYQSDDGVTYDPGTDYLDSTVTTGLVGTNFLTFVGLMPTKSYVIAVIAVDNDVDETDELDNQAWVLVI